MIFIDSKTDGGKIKGKLALYCRLMEVSRQGFYDYLHTKDKPYKYASLVKAIKEIIEEDEYNDTYGRIRMYQALMLKQSKGGKKSNERRMNLFELNVSSNIDRLKLIMI